MGEGSGGGGVGGCQAVFWPSIPIFCQQEAGEGGGNERRGEDGVFAGPGLLKS